MSRKIYPLILCFALCFNQAAGQIINTICGDGTMGTSSDGTGAFYAWVAGPQGVVKYGDKIYYCESMIDKVRFIGPDGFIGTVAGTGVAGYSGDGGLAINAKLYDPGPVAVDNAGNIFFVDQSSSVVRKISTSGIITTIAGGQGFGYSGDGGHVSLAKFRTISDIAFDNAGNLYIVDWWTSVVRKVNMSTGIITTVIGTGNLGFSGDGGPATAANTNGTYCIVIDNAGNIYITDAGNKRIRKVNPAGIITTIAGTGVAGNGGDGGPAIASTLSYPIGLTMDVSGNLYVYDTVGVIRKITTAGIISRFAGTGISGFSGDNGPPLAARINAPYISIDADGIMYISDYGHNRIRAIYCPPINIWDQTFGDRWICLAQGNTDSLYVDVSNATGYQWQVNTGSGWNNITNNATYSGATAAVLHITGIVAGMNNYQYRCRAYNNCSELFSDPVNMYVTAPVTPAVSITASANNICPGTAVTFTATGTNGGSSPTYSWYKNGTWVGVGTSFTTSILANGDVITCRLFANNFCATVSNALSNAITVVVNSTAPSIVIAASANNICQGATVAFTATITNPGTGAVYQWKRNGVNVGTNSDIYATNTLINGDIITCTYSSTIACGPSVVISNSITMSINTSSPPYISISLPGGCDMVFIDIFIGNPITFNASVINGGAAPVYQWKRNGVNVGTNSPTYSAVLNFGDVITCVVTTSSTCASPNTATSNAINTDLAGGSNSIITIAASSNNICAGTPVTFTATVTNPGGGGEYQWKRNGLNVGTNSTTYTTNTLGNSELISCSYTSTGTCGTVTVNSNPISMSVNALSPPAVSINVPGGCASIIPNVSAGNPVTFVATVTNDIISPVFQWKKNGVNVGTSSPVYTGVVNFGDVMTCVVTTSSTCASPNTGTSNSITIAMANGADPAITVAASNDMCDAGEPVTFTATVTNGGVSPTFQWKKNGLNVGGNTITYTDNSPVEGDVFSCTVFSGANCVVNPAATATITFTCTACGPPGGIITTIAYPYGLPLGAVMGHDGNIYFTHAAKVSKITPAGTIITVAGQNASGYGGDGGPATSALLAYPAVVVTAPDGTYYFNEFTNQVLRKVNPAGIISTLANILGTGGEGSPLNLARFQSIEDIYLDNAGDLYIVDRVGNKVKKVNMATNQTFTIAGTGVAGFSGDGGPAIAAQFNKPTSVAVDNLGNIYITDEGNYRIRKIDPSGIITTFAGTGLSGKTGDGGQALSATLFKPHDLDVDNSGNVYLGDWGNGVRKISASGIITRIAGNGIFGYNGDGGPATLARTGACNISVDANKNIYISDFDFNAVRKVTCGEVSINRQPVDTTVCNVPANARFSVLACNATSYQWQVNTGSGWTDIGNNATYSGATTKKLDITGANATMNNYQYRCVAYSDCKNVMSSPAILKTRTAQTPAVTIVTSTGIACQGANSIFTATPQYGGLTPFYQWKKNGTNVGTNSNTYSSNTLVNGDQVTCVITASADECVTTPTATSNIITVAINPIVTPAVTIAASANNICGGTPVTFTLTSANGGSAPFYQWQKNGVNVGAGTTYTDNTLITGDVIRCALISNAPCTAGSGWVFSNEVTMTIVTAVTPTVSIASSGNNVCAGTAITFNTTITNGGAAPVYQWKKNGVNVGTNNNSYTDNTLSNGDIVTCVLTSNSPCATTPNTTSNGVTMIINPITPPSITLAATANTICAGTPVTFSSVIANGGGTPVYQWKKNGINVGTNNNSYTDNTLNNGDIITCILTPSATCAVPATATSNNITMIVNPLLTPSISVTASGNTVCAGTPVTFSSVIVNGGAAPVYQWKKNGMNVGTNNNSFTDNTLNNGDIISCMLSSNAVCATPATATSNTITMIVNPLLPPSITVTGSANTICAGTPVTFSSVITNGGTIPIYQWKKNGVNVGTNNNSYTDNTLNNGDIITCLLNSNAVCATPASITSNNVTMIVNPVLTPAVSITASSAVICAGTPVTFSSVIANGGAAPVYQWKKNGVNVGTSINSYTDNTLNNGDIISCVLSSNQVCTSAPTAASNSITMTVNPVLTPSIIVASSANTICAGTNVNFTAAITNGGTIPVYQWKLNGSSVGANSPFYSSTALNNSDIITCQLTSGYSCAAPALVTSNSVQMTVDPVLTPAVTISIADNSICAGTTAVFNAVPVNGGALPAYEWKKNGVPVGTSSPTYTDIALNNTDAITCMITSNANCLTAPTANSNVIAMTIYNNPVVTLDQTPTLCTGAVRQLDAGAFSSYTWSTGQVSRTINVTGAGTYSVTVTDNNGCNGTGSSIISTMLPQPLGFLPPDTSFCNFGSLTLQPYINYNSYNWSTGSVSSSINTNQPGTYWLEVTDNNNCKGRSTVLVIMKQCLKGLYIPTAFTPNHDGKNDIFKPMLFGDIKKFDFILYNRWGNVVFRTTNPDQGWDGTFKGTEASTQVFVWICSYQLEGEPAKVEKGTVTMIR